MYNRTIRLFAREIHLFATGNIRKRKDKENQQLMGGSMYSLDDIKNVDPEIAQAIRDEYNRQSEHIELIASEN